MSSPQLDPVSVAVTLLAAALSPSVGAVLGPYAIIFIAATTGAGWSLSRRDRDETKTSAFWFFLRVNATACLLTSGIATLISKFYHLDSLEWSFAGIAFAMGLIGDEWPALGRWALAMARRKLGGAKE